MDRALFDAVPKAHRINGPPDAKTEREATSVYWTFVRRCPVHRIVPSPMQQGRRSLSLLRLSSAPAWESKTACSPVDLPCSCDRHRRSLSSMLLNERPHR